MEGERDPNEYQQWRLGNSGQSQPTAFVDYHLPALSSKAVIDFQALVRAFVGVSAHIGIGDLYIQRVVLNYFLKASGYVVTHSPLP